MRKLGVLLSLLALLACEKQESCTLKVTGPVNEVFIGYANDDGEGITLLRDLPWTYVYNEIPDSVYLLVWCEDCQGVITLNGKKYYTTLHGEKTQYVNVRVR